MPVRNYYKLQNGQYLKCAAPAAPFKIPDALARDVSEFMKAHRVDIEYGPQHGGRSAIRRRYYCDVVEMCRVLVRVLPKNASGALSQNSGQQLSVTHSDSSLRIGPVRTGAAETMLSYQKAGERVTLKVTQKAEHCGQPLTIAQESDLSWGEHRDSISFTYPSLPIDNFCTLFGVPDSEEFYLAAGLRNYASALRAAGFAVDWSCTDNYVAKRGSMNTHLMGSLGNTANGVSVSFWEQSSQLVTFSMTYNNAAVHVATHDAMARFHPVRSLVSPA